MNATNPGENTMQLDARQLATVLAALRLWQRTDWPPADLCDIATDGAEMEPLSVEEIDELCERLKS